MRLITKLIVSILIFWGCKDDRPVAKVAPAEIVHNNIRNYLVKVAGNITTQSLKDITTAQEWNNFQPARYQQFVEMISLSNMPLTADRETPKVTVTGTIQMDGYRIEKLHYQSLPGLYVPANLYIPDNITEPTAAIIYVCGHARSQKVRYQTHPQKFVKLGFVCLIPETIQWGEVEGEHWGCYANGWFDWYSKGYTPAGVEVWNAIRGLDLLASMDEVDASKLGATGISGGGAISWFLGAVDQRVKAVAPVCGLSTIQGHITTRTVDGHCDCMMCINTYGWDTKDIGALIAPRPLLIAQADRDGLNKVESAKEVYQDLQSFYRMLGVPENISYIETPGGHSYHKDSRELIFSFFMKHLKGIEISPEEVGDIDESPEATLSAEELMVYTSGPPVDDITTTIQDSFLELATPPEIADAGALEIYRTQVKDRLMERTFYNFPESDCELNPQQVFRTIDYADYGEDKYHITTENGWKLKATIYWRHPKEEKRPMMIVLRNPNEAKNESEAFSNQLNSQWNVAIVDVRGIGESGWSPDLQWHIRRASAWTGRTIASMRVYDLIRFMEFCRSLPGVDPETIGIAARGEMGVVALYGAFLDSNCHTVILQNPPATQNTASNKDGRGPAIEMLNCLQITDINQLPALISPTRTVFLGEIPESYHWAFKSLKSIGQANLIETLDSLNLFRGPSI
jgi:cephalosporin-C deacetylase-like acetyl esterase